MLAGPLRFYLHSMGLTGLIFVPRVLLFAWVFVLIASRFASARVFAAVLVIALATAVGALRRDLSAALVGLNAILPFFAGIAASFTWRGKLPGVRLLLAVAIAGVLLDSFLPLPWEGSSIEFGNLESTTSKSWRFGELERLAGFARSSTLAALQILAFVAIGLPRFSGPGRLLACGGAATAVLLTTSKAGAVALVVVLLVWALYQFRGLNIAQPTFAVLLAAGLALPLGAGLLQLDTPQVLPGEQTLFSSTQIRFTESWPRSVQRLVEADYGVLGLGTSSSYASQSLLSLDEPLVVDNVFLYAAVVTGLPGLIFLLSLIRFSRASWNPGKSEVLLALSFAAAGVTNNVLESGAFAFLAGSALAYYKLQPTSLPAPTTRVARVKSMSGSGPGRLSAWLSDRP